MSLTNEKNKTKPDWIQLQLTGCEGESHVLSAMITMSQTHINSAGRSGELQRCSITPKDCSEWGSVAHFVSVLDLYPKLEEPSITNSSPPASPPRSGAFTLEASSSASTLRVPSLNVSAHMPTHMNANIQSIGSFFIPRTLPFCLCLCSEFYAKHSCMHWS